MTRPFLQDHNLTNLYIVSMPKEKEGRTREDLDGMQKSTPFQQLNQGPRKMCLLGFLGVCIPSFLFHFF
jgi:hypothetical protein